MRPYLIIASLALLLCIGSTDSLAQPEHSGYRFTYLLNWPPALYERAGIDEDVLYPYDLLPFVDSLALGYAHSVEGEQPILDFLLSWTPGAYGVLDDYLVPYDELPEDVRIVAVDFHAEVFVDDEPVAALRLALDSLMLAPSPDVHAFAKVDTAWEAVFANTSAGEARAFFAAGFTLRNLEIDRIAFASFGQEIPEEGREPGVAYPRYPPHVGVYPPHIGIWVDWIYRPGAGKRGVGRARGEPREGIGRDLPSAPERPRTRTGTEGERDQGEADRAGRTPTGDRDKAAAERGKDKKTSPRKPGKKDDEDDDEDLLPAALVGVAAVGALAFFGGTLGYYGNTEAPLGLTAGFVRPEGGALLQVAVNEAVLGGGGREQLIGKVTAFYDFFKAPVQPAFGLGVLAREDGDDVELTPGVSFGAVGNFGKLVLFGGYDLTVGGVDFGLAINFRSKGRK